MTRAELTRGRDDPDSMDTVASEQKAMIQVFTKNIFIYIFWNVSLLFS